MIQLLRTHLHFANSSSDPRISGDPPAMLCMLHQVQLVLLCMIMCLPLTSLGSCVVVARGTQAALHGELGASEALVLGTVREGLSWCHQAAEEVLKQLKLLQGATRDTMGASRCCRLQAPGTDPELNSASWAAGPEAHRVVDIWLLLLLYADKRYRDATERLLKAKLSAGKITEKQLAQAFRHHDVSLHFQAISLQLHYRQQRSGPAVH